MHRTLLRVLILTALTVACGSGVGSPAAQKVVVIGLDGLTWRFLDPLIEEHKLPNIERLIHGSAHGELETFRPTKSGILWTSVATGKTMAKHGITDWTFVDKKARQEIEQLRLVTGIDRTAATIWEILSEKGRSVSVVNWWVSYPARPVRGTLVTDRLKTVIFKKSVVDEEHVVYPRSLMDELRPTFISPPGAAPSLQKYGFPHYTPEDAEAMFATSKIGRGLFASLAAYVGQDQMVSKWALQLFHKGQPDFFGVILRITDVYAHFAWRFADRATLERITPDVELAHLTHDDSAVRNRAHNLVAELDREVAKAIYPAYKFADDFVGQIVSSMDPNSIVMVVSDHGFIWKGGGYDHNTRTKYPRKSPPGVIILKGNGIQATRIKGASLFDVTPTILYAMREPIARDMDGRALKEAFDEPYFFGAREERFIASYGTGAPNLATAPSRDAEDEMLKDLRTLGYIGGGPSPQPKPGAQSDAEGDEEDAELSVEGGPQVPPSPKPKS